MGSIPILAILTYRMKTPRNGRFFISCAIERQHFDGNFLLQALMNAIIDRAHAALPELGEMEKNCIFKPAELPHCRNGADSGS